MDIVFEKKLEKLYNNQRQLEKEYGTRRAKRIRQRLDDLRAANTLEDMRSLPGRCHELQHDRAGQLSLDLDHPYRLIFQPENDPVPVKPDGGLDWKTITAVRILGVVDTHE
ncbi:type II toxin-antitoxin system RelE/ParE family toxin [Candidatus Synechococcus calcipolaris G9]|uniref:Type II toxin-antitoxin system RelE/ParE family toxin n=1 Tax=Candidatus Synechococcus calcipolaris G9 TaxID=1497997 RepID=A0ABT6EXC1_9SYNE|nr:type II toxin-antitoxin system RelE/ParE family toxin [Candidatus Synechococcus calcipolaris]MDG2989886.1 type II toxin-antitoxin system RelE/ParE family toxin [Candidatus Synechococcus calcipolaris G9]